jgi:hypothetical protein
LNNISPVPTPQVHLLGERINCVSEWEGERRNKRERKALFDVKHHPSLAQQFSRGSV